MNSTGKEKSTTYSTCTKKSTINNSVIVGIHQPNFLPWLGYFHKINQSTDFVFLDNVQIETGSQQAYVNRCKIYGQTSEEWLTCPISKENSKSNSILDIQFVTKFDWRKKILKTLYFNYRKAQYFEETYSTIEPLILNPNPSLCEYNIELITRLSEQLEIQCEFKRASDLGLISMDKSERIAEICDKLESSIYLSGKGGLKYHNTEYFESQNIQIKDASYSVKEYEQHKEFIGGLSIVDGLFHLGFDKVKFLIGG